MSQIIDFLILVILFIFQFAFFFAKTAALERRVDYMIKYYARAARFSVPRPTLNYGDPNYKPEEKIEEDTPGLKRFTLNYEGFNKEKK